MNHAEACDDRRWYTIRTHPKQEDRASYNLLTCEVETLLPKIRDCRYNQFSGAPTYTVKPLFPRYIFGRFELGALLHKIRFTRGVHSVVSFGGRPVSVDDEVITLIRGRMNEDGCVRIAEQFNPGDEVLIKDGPLKNFVGIFERAVGASDRVMILLHTIAYQGHVSVERGLLAKPARTAAAHAHGV